MYGFPEEYTRGIVCVDKTPKTTPKNDYSALPLDLTAEIFSNLNGENLANCQGVNQAYNILAKKTLKTLTPDIAFGKKQWAQYFGNIGAEPPLPSDIFRILKSPCPFTEGKTVAETHVLVLVPETVNGEPLTLKTLGELVKKPITGHPAEFDEYSQGVIEAVGDIAAPKSHWVLMTKGIIEASRNKHCVDQYSLIVETNKNLIEIGQEIKCVYSIPNALDVAVCILMHKVSQNEHLFASTSTQCQELYQQRFHVAVGNSFPSLTFQAHDVRSDDFGTAGERVL